MSFSERIKIFFEEKLQYPRVYFGKGLKGVPPGSLILFPVQDSQLNCGLTGIVAFKKRGIAEPKISISKIESMISNLKGYTHKGIREKDRNLIEDYLGGETFIKELQNIVRDLKITSSLYTIFKEAPTRKKLEEASLSLERIINGEENEYHQRLSLLSLEENEVTVKRITLLKDMIWYLKEEIVKNLEKIEELSGLTRKDIPLLAFEQIKNINTLFNNLDRLEVRGRDSAGISVIIIVEKKDYLYFKKALKARS
ncbi:MAG: hypothetical protein JSU78_04940, partial [Deltaproteobacteria bacterium]